MKRLVSAVVTFAAVVGTLLGVAAPAQAASDGYIYVVVRDSACGAPWVGVKAIQVANMTTGWSLNWDYGDNIVYPRVQLNRWNSLKLNLACFYGKRQVGYTVIQQDIYPTSYNQTIWVG